MRHPYIYKKEEKYTTNTAIARLKEQTYHSSKEKTKNKYWKRTKHNPIIKQMKAKKGSAYKLRTKNSNKCRTQKKLFVLKAEYEINGLRFNQQWRLKMLQVQYAGKEHRWKKKAGTAYRPNPYFKEIVPTRGLTYISNKPRQLVAYIIGHPKIEHDL